MTELVADTVRVGGLTGTYELRIQNYSLQPKTVGTKLTSPTFKLCERIWSLRVYPGGADDASNDSISFFLVNEENSEVTVNFTLILVSQIEDRDSVRVPPIAKLLSKKSAVITDTADRAWGHRKKLSQTLLTDADSPYIVDDTVIFRLEISIIGALIVQKCPEKRGPVLSDCLTNMMLCGEGTDVSLLVGSDAHDSERIPAHKCILMARSPVFKAMFTHNMSESNTNEIVISDFSPEVVREMLHFMYTDKLQSEILDNTVYEGLLGAAIKYDVSDLINLCEAHFCNELCDCNVVSTYKIAERWGSATLKQHVITFITENCAHLVRKVDFQPMLVKCMDIITAADLQEQQERDVEPAKKGKKRKRKGGKKEESCVIM